MVFVRLFQKRLAILVGSAILADIICRRLQVSERIDHEAVLSILTFGGVIFANDKIWRTKLFWALVVGAFCLYLAALWVLNVNLPQAHLIIGVVFVICLLGGLFLDRLINRISTGSSTHKGDSK